MKEVQPILASPAVPVNGEEMLYCICQQRATGDMIGCDNENCPYKWFHYSCLGLDPNANYEGTWYCPTCAKEMQQTQGNVPET